MRRSAGRGASREYGPGRPAKGGGGKLRIGDNWNVITIIALSQNNPLKAIAEFVENSIDAKARSITIIRGKEKGETYLKIVDDGEGIPRDPAGTPDFTYVATHIGASLKRRLKEKGAQGIQGEFGIGLLSFWTVGESLTLSSSGEDGRTYQMVLRKNEPGYAISSRKALFTHGGTELLVRPLLPGLRQLSGEKIQGYLAAELRDRIRTSGVRIRILDRSAKKELEVQPRQFTGRLLHALESVTSDRGEVSLELYLNTFAPGNQVSLFRSGTRVVSSLAEIDALDIDPWNSGYLQGMVDAPFLQLTPGTRTGVIHDESFDALTRALAAVGEQLKDIIAQEKEAEEEQASRNILRSVQKAFREAFLTLPPEDYDWFDLHTGRRRGGPSRTEGNGGAMEPGEDPDTTMPGTSDRGSAEPGDAEAPEAEREFFNYPGPLFGAVIVPSSVVMKVNSERGFRCIPRDKS
ncbi:MAG TPA: ATP-binding protein, partial [Candidatus Sulfotelmatobacter sp.]|nr:ATP-binding protein [Candidatus Sulfotelmatobacter sp.]